VPVELGQCVAQGSDGLVPHRFTIWIGRAASTVAVDSESLRKFAGRW
jgi:hypothetical protein